MRWHILQHVPFEGPTYLSQCVRREGHALSRSALWKAVSFPRVEEVDGIFVYVQDPARLQGPADFRLQANNLLGKLLDALIRPRRIDRRSRLVRRTQARRSGRKLNPKNRQ